MAMSERNLEASSACCHSASDGLCSVLMALTPAFHAASTQMLYTKASEGVHFNSSWLLPESRTGPMFIHSFVMCAVSRYG